MASTDGEMLASARTGQRRSRWTLPPITRKLAPSTKPNEEKESKIDMIDEIKAAMAKLEHAGIIERKMDWDEDCREWQPFYRLSELGRALSAAGINIDEYQNRQTD